MSRLLMSVIVACVTTAAVCAQPLADRVPSDAVIYIGWRGTQPEHPAMAGSHLQAILQESRLREAFDTSLPKALDLIAAQDPSSADAVQFVRDVLGPTWKYPTAVFFCGVDFESREPTPRFGVVCKAGPAAGQMKDAFEALIATSRGTVTAQTIEQDGEVALLFGFADGHAVLPAAGLSLGDGAPFISAMKKMPSDPQLVVYADIQAGLKVLDASLSRGPLPPLGERNWSMTVRQSIDASGLRSMKRYVMASGFDGRDWLDATYVESPASERRGLLAGSAVGPPVNALRLVPADAVFVYAGRCHFAAMLDRIRAISGEVDPEAPKLIDQGLSAVQMAMGVAPRAVLEPLGDEWAVYASPTVGGSNLFGTVVINKLDDPAKARQSLVSASFGLSNWTRVLLRQAEAPVTIEGRLTQVGELKVYYVALPIVQPSWAIKDDVLLLGLNTSSVIAASRNTPAPGAKSILNNPSYQAVSARLGVENASAVSFYDLPAVAGYGQMYQSVLLMAGYAGFGDLFNVPIPQPLTPPLDTILANLKPAGSAGWSDDDGFHTRSVQAFPFSKVLSEHGAISNGGAGFTALGVSILLPSLNRARETANRVQCGNNLREIGLGARLYANENRGNFPDSLGEIMRTQDIQPSVCVCPSDSDSELHLNALHALEIEQIPGWLDENAHYVWLGKGKSDLMAADEPLMYERPENHDFDGINVLFADGHVEFLRPEAAMQVIPGLQFPERRR